METSKTENTKVVHLAKAYNFSIQNIFKFGLHFEIGIGKWKGVKFEIWIFLKLIQLLH
jgi:hypothetical protein